VNSSPRYTQYTVVWRENWESKLHKETLQQLVEMIRHILSNILKTILNICDSA
jgi:hypothetical protein